MHENKKRRCPVDSWSYMLKVHTFTHPSAGGRGVGGIYFLSNREVGECYWVGTLGGGDFPGFFRPGCGGDHWSGFLDLRCECPPVGGQTLTHRLSVGELGDRVCDGGYGGAAELESGVGGVSGVSEVTFGGEGGRLKLAFGRDEVPGCGTKAVLAE